jgi:sulfite reductase (NADPH) hemoprotein beta-component
MGLRVAIANLLRGGNVVFLAGDGRWSAHIDEARVAESDEAAAALEARARASEDATEVVDPYLIEVERGEDGLRPVKYREWLRTRGPSVRLDLGYQGGTQPSARHA